MAQVVSRLTGIPVNELTVEEREAAAPGTTAARAPGGQDEAVRAVADAVRLSRAGLREGSKPVATFLFLGPTGVGKPSSPRHWPNRSTAMSTPCCASTCRYGERHTVARLVGAPPGYVGYDEGGQLPRRCGASPQRAAARRDREGAP
ncbi:AAA family ATPase [Enterobacter hormaechei]